MKRQTRAAVSAILMGIAGIIACSESTAPDQTRIKALPGGPSYLTFGSPAGIPPGGANVAFFGDATRGGGLTTTYTAFDLTGVTLLWGPSSNASIQLALDGAVDDPSETLTFGSTPTDLSVGRLYWTGQSTITYTLGGVSHIDMVPTRLTAQALDDGATSLGYAAADLQPFGISPSIGGAFHIIGSTFQTNIVFEVFHDGTWTPALDLFDLLGISGSQIVSQFTPAFYASYSGAHLFASATSHDFGNVFLGSSSGDASLTLQNNGGAFANVASADFSGANAGDFVVVSNGCASVAVDATCTVTVHFAPTAVGARSASLVVSGDFPSVAIQVSGTGEQGTPAIETSPAGVEFGVKNIGTVTTLPLTITNSGTAAFVHSAFTIGGANPTDFLIISDNCDASLAVNASCILSVQYTPTAAGSRSATLSIAGNAPTVIVPLTGGGVALAPIASPTPPNFAFPPLNVGQTSPPFTVQVVNTGNAPLVISVLNMLGANPLDFSASGCIGATVAPGARCFMTVTFSPKAAGARSAQVSIVSNGEPASVALTGTGNPTFPQMVIDPPSLALNFNQVIVGGGSATLPITIGNQGNGDLVLNSATIAAGPVFLDYALSGDCPPFPSVLEPGSTCHLLVTFDPTAAGPRNTSLSLSTNVGTRTFQLSGSGVVPAPLIQVSPTFLNFGNVVGGGNGSTLPVTITNGGTANLLLNSASITGPAAAEFALSGSCTPIPGVVAPGTSCQLLVTFDPTVAGTRNATVVLSTNAGPPQSIGLAGFGVIPAPRVQFNAGQLAFSNTQIGSTSFNSSPPNVTVTNIGNADLVISSINLTGLNASEFVVRNQNCTFTPIPPNGTCVFDMAFSPTATGPRSAQVFLSANVTSTPVQLVGTGIGQSGIFVSPTNLAYSARPVGTSSPSQAVTITNTGNLPLHLFNTSLGGASPGDFAITGTTCPSAIAPATACTVSVSFNPVSGGTRQATLTISSDANLGGVPVNLSGIALLPGDLAASLSADPVSGKAGKPLTYTIGITNYGPGVATDLVITDALPASTTFASIVAPAGVSCTTPAVDNVGAVVCRSSSLSSGGSISISLTVNLLSGGKASISNTVNVSSSSADPTAANNSATVATTVGGRR